MNVDLEGRTVVVVGLGRSGVAAARLCSARGARVIGTDSAELDQLSDAARSLPVVVAGGHQGVAFDEADLVVVSPGVPSFPALERAEARGVEVIGELELAARFVRAPMVAVGGTNGKSTTTTLVARLLEGAGHRTFAGGNLGIPLSEAVGASFDVLVVEVSSFQLERAPTFHPVVSVLLNVSEDHLDRYPDFEAYARAKGNAFARQGPADTAVVPAGDEVCAEQARRGGGRLLTFGPGGDYAVHGRGIVERAAETHFSLENVDLYGAHNLSNAAASVAAARAFGASVEGIRDGLARFRSLPHRTARVADVGGVVFYDDSKGTNVGAAVTALLGLEEPKGVLIAGGRDKHGAYEPLVQALERKGRAVVLIGEAAPRIAAAIGDRVRTERASSMEEAVRRARQLARPGDAVLLSPACSSFDMFQNYADRGERFVAAVRSLATERVS